MNIPRILIAAPSSGSGKTVIAFLAMILSAENGFQSALMVPTEVLANQHYEGFLNLMEEQKI